MELEVAAKSLVWMLTTLDRTVINVASMRRSIERLEMYMLAMVALLYGLLLVGIVGGLIYYFMFAAPRRRQEKMLMHQQLHLQDHQQQHQQHEDYSVIPRAKLSRSSREPV